MNSRFLSLIVSVVVALAPVAAFGGDPPSVGAVYVMSNDAEGNQVIVFERDVHGRLTLADSYPTQGLGTGGDIDPLGSQGSLILSADHRWLIAVNAGSDDIAVFRVLKHGLELIGNFASRGASPVSLALHRDLLYVLNAGRDPVGPSITGFILNSDGELTPLAGSTRSLGPGGFHQVDFNPRGDTLVVTQGDPTGVNAILVFGVDKDGLPGAAPTVSPSFGLVPFGFITCW
jgi:6-phosphogluconolactonase